MGTPSRRKVSSGGIKRQSAIELTHGGLMKETWTGLYCKKSRKVSVCVNESVDWKKKRSKACLVLFKEGQTGCFPLDRKYQISKENYEFREQK